MDYKTAAETGDFAKYLEKLFALLEGQDPLDVFDETSARLEALTRGMGEEQLRAPEREGKWSVLEVAQHLADVELMVGIRIRRIVAESNPALGAFDQDLWTDGLKYNERDLSDVLEDFAAFRKANLRLLRSLEPEQFDRCGMHSERGEESLAFTVKLYAAHDRYHLGQIERIKKAIGAG